MTCPACFSSNLEVFHEQENVPAHSVMLMPSREVATSYPRGNMKLTFCRDCGFIFNQVFDVSLNDYSTDCEESQGCSPTFRSWLTQMTQDLVNNFDLHNKTILEIGC